MRLQILANRSGNRIDLITLRTYLTTGRNAHMTRFIQIHALTVYPLSNPNRDDTGRPKTAQFGGVPRLRLSSQSLKRAIRIADVVRDRLAGHLGERTQRFGEVISEALKAEDLNDEQRKAIIRQIVDVFGKIDAKAEQEGEYRTAQLAFISPAEKQKAIELARAAAQGEKLPSDKELARLILRTADGAVDVAMFGRMLADDPEFNREAAVQLSHAFTTHRAVVEDDFYTAVDDRKKAAEDMGAGFIGEAGFGSGVFYLYACIDRDLLEANLDGDSALASRAIVCLVDALSSATPSGKRSSFAHQTRASYLLVEKGRQQPRSLASAFLKPVQGEDLLERSIEALRRQRQRMESAYGSAADELFEMNLLYDKALSVSQLAESAGS